MFDAKILHAVANKKDNRFSLQFDFKEPYAEVYKKYCEGEFLLNVFGVQLASNYLVIPSVSLGTLWAYLFTVKDVYKHSILQAGLYI